MPLIPITFQDFASRRWLPHSNFEFARERGLIELNASELPGAVCSLPVGFLPQVDGGYMPAALLGIDPSNNLFVTPDASWAGGYVPLALQLAPFVSARSETGENVICVDDSFTSAEGEAGQPFFTPEGQPSQALLGVRDILSRVSANRDATRIACAALQEAQLLEPWDIVISTPSGERHLEGLYRVNEDALNGLDAEMLVMLRDRAALALAYCQLVSMQHLGRLRTLTLERANQEAAARQVMSGAELSLDFLNQGGTIGFGNL